MALTRIKSDQINNGTINGNHIDSNTDISSNNITLTGDLRGPAVFTIDPAAIGDNTGTVVIAGDLQVDGETTTINSSTLTVDDKQIVIASGATDNTSADGAGILIDGANAEITYDGANDRFEINKDVNVSGDIIIFGTVDGRDIASDGSKLDGIESNAKDDQTISAGSGLTGGGTGDVTLNHADTSTQGSVNNSGSTVIQDVTLDGFGHVTNLNSKTLTASDVGALGVNDKAADADQLDGLNSSQFLRSDTSDTMSGNLDVNGRLGAERLVLDNSERTSYSLENGLIIFDQAGGNNLNVYNTNLGRWVQIWDDSNDGSGSGLDADLLDGLNSSQFLRSDTNDTLNGSLTLAGDNFIRFGPGTPSNDDAHIEWGGSSNSGRLRISTSDDIGSEYIEFGDYDNKNRGGAFTQWLRLDRGTSSFSNNLDMNNNDIQGVDQILHHGDTNTYMQFHASDQWRVVTGGAERLEVNNSRVKVTGEFAATGDLTVDSGTLFVDSANNRVGVRTSSPDSRFDVDDYLSSIQIWTHTYSGFSSGSSIPLFQKDNSTLLDTFSGLILIKDDHRDPAGRIFHIVSGPQGAFGNGDFQAFSSLSYKNADGDGQTKYGLSMNGNRAEIVFIAGTNHGSWNSGSHNIAVTFIGSTLL